MKNTKISVISAFAIAMIALAGPAAACDDPELGGPGCPPVEEPERGNPGNAKPVGNSPWDGITGYSGNNNPGPRATPMDGQRTDTPFAQPGGKGDGPSPEGE